MTAELIELQQQLLALEHESIWTFETIAARNDSLTKRGQASAQSHREVRDRIRASLLIAGAEPVTAQPGYASSALNSTEQMKSHAQQILKDLVVLYLKLIAQTRESERATFVAEVTNASVEIIRWGGQAEAFPGLDN